MSTKSAMSSSDLAREQVGRLKLKREIPAWVISVLMHAAVLFVLALITHATDLAEQITVVTMVQDLDDPEYVADASIMDQIGTEGTFTQLTDAQQSATEMGQQQQEQAEQELEDELLAVDIPVTNQIIEPNEANLQEEVDTTGTTENAGGVEGAIDRITLEIAASLREGKTLVCWVFDVSPSLSKRRELIANRFENVYRQLGVLDVNADKSLITGVAAFGAQTTFLTPEPVSDVQDIVSAIRKVSPDTSGDENVFTAVHDVAKRWSKYRRSQDRKMMIIVVTDEAGSDQAVMEETINYVKRYGIRCYVVGNAAPFGRRVVRTEWELDNGDIVMAEMDQGPESIFPERLQLPFWGANGSDLNNMSSGFGPYGLTRLCAESNGLYFISAETPGPRFDHEVMRGYQPDYIPIKTFDQRVRKDPAKSALLNASLVTWNEGLAIPQLGFNASNDTELRQQITNAQMPIAKLDAALTELEKILEVGEKNRPKVREARWRAGYDLAMGRVLAMHVRAFGYNTLLAEMKSSPLPFENDESNFWVLKPSQEISSGPAVGKAAKRATEYLTRVIDEHPGTPWARLAELELSQPLGWAWEESRVPTQEEMDEQRRNNPQFAEEERERMERARNLAKPPIKI